MHQLNRRAFLKSTAGLIALATLDLTNLNCASSNTSSPRAARGANNRLNVAVLGLGMRGPVHINNLGAKENCRIMYVCDADTARAQAAIDKARTSNDGFEPRFVQDLRQILDDREVDIVTVAAPNHWHSLAAIWAMQAGKDVYVEKPISHNLLEGRRVLQVAAKTQRVCQHGSQMRSNPAIIEALSFVRGGALGKMLVSRGLCYKQRPSIGKVHEPQAPPSTVDYDLWCGPAPLAPVMRTKFHYDWHWFWDNGNGDIGNQGIHEIDLARWALGTEAMPKSVLSVGGRFGYVDDGQTPNTQIASFDFGADHAKVIIEVRGLKSEPYHTNGVENVVECENGFLVSPKYTAAVAYDRDGNVVRKFEEGNDHNNFRNFLDVVRGAAPMRDLHAPAIEAHRSCALLHMANISYRLGQQVPFEPSRSGVFGDKDADQAFEKMTKHLVDNNVALSESSFMMGRRLQFNADSETFAKDDQANAMRTREYRKPFVVPERA
jgi:predicted dehydrogenase